MLSDSSASHSQIGNSALRPAAMSDERRAAARARLDHDGLTASEWARQNGYASSIALVNRILAGKRKALYGTGREIALKLGLIDG